MKKYSWYRLDNSAIVYQMVLTEKAQSLYRLCINLKTEVDETALRKAIEKSLERYPSFNSELKRGFFRPYLDENKRPPVIEKDDGVLLKILNFKRNNKYLFRTTYFDNKIFLDFFHGLCDGSAALEFTKTVTYYYFEALKTDFPPDNILTLDVPLDPEETEDAFSRYYTKPNLKNGISSMASGTAFGMPGKRFKYDGFGLIEVSVSTAELVAASHEHNCTITSLLTALMIVSIADTYFKEPQKFPITAFIPINLRKRYPSKTLGNFTVFAKLVIPVDTEYTLSNLINIVTKKLSEQLDENELLLKTGFSSLMAELPLLKFMPLYFKARISRISRYLSKPKQTFILSNLGEIAIGKNDNLDGFSFNLNCNSKTPKNIAVASYNGKTTIAFTRKLIDTKVERTFCLKLAEICKDIEVISNFREEYSAL